MKKCEYMENHSEIEEVSLGNQQFLCQRPISQTCKFCDSHQSYTIILQSSSPRKRKSQYHPKIISSVIKTKNHHFIFGWAIFLWTCTNWIMKRLGTILSQCCIFWKKTKKVEKSHEFGNCEMWGPSVKNSSIPNKLCPFSIQIN